MAAGGRAAAVIDGMGGYRRQTATGEVGGEHASALAARVLAERLDGWDGSATLAETRAALRPVIEEVNRRMWEELNWAGNIPPEENPEGKTVDQLSVGAAMTLVALCDGGSRAVVAQHGDTHGYVLKEEVGLIQITEDQDLLLWERLNGRITEEEAARISQVIDEFDGINVSDEMDQQVMRYFFDKNIFGALGVATECPETGWSVIKLVVGDRLVLLSDGAYSNMSIPELGSLLAFPDDPADVVVDLAMQRGLMPRFPDVNDLAQPFNMRATQDDMTAVIVVVGEEAEVGMESAEMGSGNAEVGMLSAEVRVKNQEEQGGVVVGAEAEVQEDVSETVEATIVEDAPEMEGAAVSADVQTPAVEGEQEVEAQAEGQASEPMPVQSADDVEKGE